MSETSEKLGAYLESRRKDADDYVVDDWIAGAVMEEFEPRTLELGTLRALHAEHDQWGAFLSALFIAGARDPSIFARLPAELHEQMRALRPAEDSKRG